MKHFDKIINLINDLLLKITGISLSKPYPKHSIRFGKKYFRGKQINAIEIGVSGGLNSKYILDNLNIKRLYLVDPYDDYVDNSNEYKDVKVSKDFLSKMNKIAKRRLRKYEKKISWIKKYSNDALNIVPMVDYIYIDGNHSYEYVLDDCKNYWQKVKNGGILAGHDISMVGVLNAVQDFCKEEKLNFQVAGQDWWIVKMSNVQEMKQ